MARPEMTCPKCRRWKKMTGHHIIPKSVDKKSRHIFLLCRECHQDLHKLIPQGRLTHTRYFIILLNFLQETAR